MNEGLQEKKPFSTSHDPRPRMPSCVGTEKHGVGRGESSGMKMVDDGVDDGMKRKSCDLRKTT